MARTARSTRRTLTAAVAAMTMALGAMAFPAPAAAHCDGLDGPVVAAARTALATGDVRPALAWVRAEDEAEIRHAFDHARTVRALGAEAETVADRWFFETLVRVHRAGEGAPFTGLKPAGAEVAEGVVVAEAALADPAAAPLGPRLAGHVASAVDQRLQRVRELAGYDPTDVEAGRAWVEAYVDYIHFVEALVALVHGGPSHAEGGHAGH